MGLPASTTQPGDPCPPLPSGAWIELQLFGYNENQSPPGTLIEGKRTDAYGFYNFFVVRPRVYDTFRLVILPPTGRVVAAILSRDGTILDPTTVVWFRPAPEIHLTNFYLEQPTATPTPTNTPTLTPTYTSTPTPRPHVLFLPLLCRR